MMLAIVFVGEYRYYTRTSSHQVRRKPYVFPLKSPRGRGLSDLRGVGVAPEKLYEPVGEIAHWYDE